MTEKLEHLQNEIENPADKLYRLIQILKDELCQTQETLERQEQQSQTDRPEQLQSPLQFQIEE